MQIPIDSLPAARRALLQTLLPDGVPALWCPLLTHYRVDGSLDHARMRQHLDALKGSVGGLLVPGSTGDGWELDDAEVRTLLAFLLPEAKARGMAVLIGVLKTTTDAVLATLADTMAWLRQSTGVDGTDLATLRAAGVCGFTVCPPAGAELAQDALRSALDTVLASGLPIALYQLPQVTGNEMSPATVAALAARHPNFLFFKDTSGADRVATAGQRDVVMVRGAEGGYSGHLRAAGGAYDGFLLSTANVFGPALAELIDDVAGGRRQQADATSARIAAVVDTVFTAAAPLPFGNAFTNANKALDHHMAHGPGALNSAGPRLHAGPTLPAALIALAGEALQAQRLQPLRGYLA